MEDVDFLDNGTRVSALNPKTYVFQRDMSVGPESDRIRTVNIPAAVRRQDRVCSYIVKYVQLAVTVAALCFYCVSKSFSAHFFILICSCSSS